jgi:predicted RNA-binding Zn-ribbon protein involved in translation (DUF1610 family)
MAKGDFTRSFAAWMQGRNGADDLARVTSTLAVILVIVALFSGWVWATWIALALIVYSDWRMLSKNVAARARESERFMEALGPLRPWVATPKAAFAEARAYKHFKCPNCHQKVRVPRGKGKVRITCSKCGTSFEGKA